MKIKKIHFGAAVVLFLLVAWIVFAGSSASTGKPTEKTFALLACESFWVIAENAAQENHSVFEISKLNADEKSKLVSLSQSWHNGADFLIKTNFTAYSSTNEVVIISNWELNTTEPTVWSFFQKHPAHALRYSDGTAGLISPEQFTNLNLTGFISLSNFATNSEFDIFK